MQRLLLGSLERECPELDEFDRHVVPCTRSLRAHRDAGLHLGRTIGSEPELERRRLEADVVRLLPETQRCPWVRQRPPARLGEDGLIAPAREALQPALAGEPGEDLARPLAGPAERGRRLVDRDAAAPFAFEPGEHLALAWTERASQELVVGGHRSSIDANCI